MSISINEIGKSAVKASSQGLGCMSMSEFYGEPIPTEQALQLFAKAYEQGVNFFDTADVYGYGRNEELVGQALSSLLKGGVARSALVVATKCGIVRDEHDVTRRGVDNSSQYIKDCCEKSLVRLNKAGNDIGHIDLFYIHRLVGLEHVDEAMLAMAQLLEEGKIKAVGLSEVSPEIIEKANKALLVHTNQQHQLAAIQSEYSLLTRAVETNGVLETCRKLGITFVAYSPLSRALLTESIDDVEQLEASDFRRTLPRFQAENLAHNKAVVAHVKKIADSKNCTTAQVALAWVLHQENVVPIPGTTKEKNLMMNVQAGAIQFAEKELSLLSGLSEAKGYRYTEAAMKAYGLEGELD